MILFASGRTDIPAFYGEWFHRRYQAGFVDVRNPFRHELVSRMFFSDCDLIQFCSKNPRPFIPYLKEITQPILFHVTLTPYRKDIEPNVPEKKEVVEDIKTLSRLLGKDRVFLRYDPIFLSDAYPLSYHLKAFDRLCSLLDGSIETIIVSFLDRYKNVEKNIKTINPRPFTEEDYQAIGEGFSASANAHGMSVQTCFEERNLLEYGFVHGCCLSQEFAYHLTGKKFPRFQGRKGGLCGCAQTCDIGAYNSCSHRCKYCYANYSEEEISHNLLLHDDDSTMLLGHLEEGDVIKIRK